MTTAARTRVPLLPLLLVLLGLPLVGLVGAVQPAATLEPAAAATTPSHPYGDPVWFPLRTPASVGCARSDCGTTKGHGYWALDFLGAKGDPVYAAGAGIAHIGGTSGACVSSSSAPRDGRWVWIDHGGGVVTRYHHLSAITITEGQAVTPATRIGAMGNSGDTVPCPAQYLHFEVRHGGLKGTRVDPGPLRGCTAAGVVSLPQVLGASGWDDPALHPQKRLTTPALTSACVDAGWTASPAQPTPTVRRGNHTVTVGLARVPGADRWTVRFETYHPSTREWSTVYREVPATATSTVFTGLENSRGYRAAVAAHGSGGWSRWSARVTALGTPGAPPSPRYLTWPKADYVHYGWNRPESYGSTVTSFTVARRCAASGGSLGSWRSYTQGAADTYRNLRGLSGYRRCEVKVRATNAVGAGAWSRTSTVTR